MLNFFNIPCYAYKIKKQFYPVNDVRVFTVIDSDKALRE